LSRAKQISIKGWQRPVKQDGMDAGASVMSGTITEEK
jgi:hypothetical protein